MLPLLPLLPLLLLDLTPHSLPSTPSGVIKTSEKELYIEAEQRVPISPQGSWGMHPSPGSWGSAAVIGSPVSKRDSSGVEHGCVGVLWGADVQEGDPVGIITIEDVIEEVGVLLGLLRLLVLAALQGVFAWCCSTSAAGHGAVDLHTVCAC